MTQKKRNQTQRTTQPKPTQEEALEKKELEQLEEDQTKQETEETSEKESETSENLDETKVEEKEEEIKKEEPPKEPEVTTMPSTPMPRARNKGGLVKVAAVASKAPLIEKITVEELIQRKHDFDITTAEGPLAEIIEFLDRYEEQMKPGNTLQFNLCESLQKQLFKNYLRILTLSPVLRAVGMEYLLWKFFRNEKRTFRVNELSRHTRNGKWEIKDLQMFLQMSNIFNLVKDPAERIARLRSVDLASTVSIFPSEKANYTESFISWATTLK